MTQIVDDQLADFALVIRRRSRVGVARALKDAAMAKLGKTGLRHCAAQQSNGGVGRCFDVFCGG